MQIHVCAAWDAKCCIDSCAARWGTCEALLRGNGRFLDGHAAACAESKLPFKAVPDDFGSLGPKQCHVIRDGDQSPSCCPPSGPEPSEAPCSILTFQHRAFGQMFRCLSCREADRLFIVFCILTSAIIQIRWQVCHMVAHCRCNTCKTSVLPGKVAVKWAVHQLWVAEQINALPQNTVSQCLQYLNNILHRGWGSEHVQWPGCSNADKARPARGCHPSPERGTKSITMTCLDHMKSLLGSETSCLRHPGKLPFRLILLFRDCKERNVYAYQRWT